ncbi:unnamed protein product [Clonostachys rosea f. rosea IK726]|uniref:Uncharacterized protein n=1 Tax=Clonostachys rosea f. rosea IK726 TaxID=1349383 RepID=A0ACA9UGZ7_BIOOC|nr:unnamed protein product [Clonostachys rosea f. rosea IK726]
MVRLLKNSINFKFDTIESKFGKADPGVQPPCPTSMEIHINAILVKPIYTLDGTQWHSNDAHHLRDLKPFLVLYLFCAHRAFAHDNGFPVLGLRRSGVEKNFHIIPQDGIDIPSISHELPGNIARCWTRNLNEKDLHRPKGHQASRTMLLDPAQGSVWEKTAPNCGQSRSPIKQHHH